MKQSGRASLLTILAVAAILIVVAMFAFSRESVTTVGSCFMTALQSGDVETLTEMTYLGDEPKEKIREKWDFTVNTAGQHYVFSRRIVGSTEANQNNANVRMMVAKNANRMDSYEEELELPLIKVDNKWKIDVRSISRELYPALPR